MTKTLGLPLTLLVTGWLLISQLAPQLEVNADTERDLFRTAEITDLKQWPESGPAIDHFPITLGPGWYLTVAPIAAFSKQPIHIHIFHVIFFCIGLYALFLCLISAVGDGAALVTCLLIGTSAWTTDVMSRIWHNALVPATTVFWFSLLYLATTHLDQRRRASALAVCWVLTALMLQLHLVNSAYLALLVAVQGLHWARFGFKQSILSSLISALVGLALIVSTSATLSSLDWAAVATIKDQRGTGTPAIGAMLEALPGYLQSGWSDVANPWLGLVILFFACFGAFAVIVGRGPEVVTSNQTTVFGRWVLAQVIVGLCAVSVFASLDTAARYYNGVIPGIYVLASLGLGTTITRAAPQLSGPVAVIAAVIVSLWGQWNPQNTEKQLRTDATLTLYEQQGAIETLYKKLGISYTDLMTRVHGPLFGPLSATRYLAWAQGMHNVGKTTELEDNENLTIAPEGFPLPKAGTAEGVIRMPNSRELKFVVRQRRINPKNIQVSVGDKACPIPMPYRWSHLTAKELKPFGLHGGYDLIRCEQGDAPLVIQAKKVRGREPLLLLLSWFDVASNYSSQAAVSSETATVKRISAEKYPNAALFKITPPASGKFELRISPIRTLAVIDLY